MLSKTFLSFENVFLIEAVFSMSAPVSSLQCLQMQFEKKPEKFVYK